MYLELNDIWFYSQHTTRNTTSTYSADLNYPDKTNKTSIFKRVFSQIWLRLDKKRTEQKLLKILSELIWCSFFSEILNQNFTPKKGHFGFFQLIKNYAETTLLIDEKFISLEASSAAQQSLGRVKSPKICANCFKFDFKQRFCVLYSKKHIY